MTVGLIAVNIIIFLIMTFSSGGYAFDTFLIKGASYWKYVYEDHQYYRLFTCMFLHFNAEHLMNNMITLAFLGTETEKALGHLRYLVIYILSGLGASILSSIYYMHNSGDTIILSAGASGAIFGILGALIIITLLSKKQRRNMKPINLIIIAVLSICNGYTTASIDNFAHIGGFLFGIIITFISCLYRKNILK
jgi:rhomboid protease GluP